mgnify:CR=1 FL=1
MRKFDNFEKAFNNLKDIYNYDEPYENVVLTGLVSLYAICFEQSWKAMKEILESEGFDMASTGSPRQIIKTAYQAGMIGDEDIWLEALKSRNDVAHSYNQDIAMDIVRDTRDKYYNMFQNLREVLKDNWI